MDGVKFFSFFFYDRTMKLEFLEIAQEKIEERIFIEENVPPMFIE